MDQPHNDRKYFLNTIPRNSYLAAVDKSTLPFSERQFDIDDDLRGISIIFVFDWAGLTLTSKCNVRAVNPGQVRGLGGEDETMVYLERADGTLCTVGLNMSNYRRYENEDYPLTWYVEE